jgi:hypothetical protein
MRPNYSKERGFALDSMFTARASLLLLGLLRVVLEWLVFEPKTPVVIPPKK